MLAFVQAGVVLIASLYLWFFASMIGVAAQDNPASSVVPDGALATEVTVLAVVQLLSVVLLIVAGCPRAQRAQPGGLAADRSPRTPSRSCSPSTGRSGWSRS